MIFWPGGSRWTVAKVPISLRATFSICMFTICVIEFEMTVGWPLYSPFPLWAEEGRGFSVGVEAMGVSEVQRKSEFLPQGQTAFEKRVAGVGWSYFGATSWWKKMRVIIS